MKKHRHVSPIWLTKRCPLPPSWRPQVPWKMLAGNNLSFSVPVLLKKHPRWFKVTFWSPSRRSLSHWKSHLTIQKVHFESPGPSGFLCFTKLTSLMIHQLPTYSGVDFPLHSMVPPHQHNTCGSAVFGRQRYAVVTTFHAPGVADGHLRSKKQTPGALSDLIKLVTWAAFKTLWLTFHYTEWLPGDLQ